MAVCCALLAACGRHDPPPPHTLVVAIESDPQSLDPRFANDAASARIGDLVHVGLTRTGRDGRPVGELAASWDWPDARTLAFRLRSDFRFPDGRTLSSTDVKATYDSVLDPATGSAKRAALAPVERVDAPDPATVVFHLRHPTSALLDATSIGILPAACARDAAECTTGAGRFRVERIERGERIVLAPNDWHPDGPPGLRSMEIRIVPDAVLRALEMRSGSIGFLQETPEPEVLDWLRHAPQVIVQERPGTSFDYLLLNFRQTRFHDRRVRRAIAHAIDRDELTRFVLGGTVQPASGLLFPDHWAYASTRAPRFDPARAARLLDRAGLPDPDGNGPRPRFRIVFKTSNQPLRRRIAEAIQAQLGRVGIAVDVRSLEWGTLFADVRSGNFEMTLLAWVGVADPDLYYLTMHSTMRPPEGYNRAGYDDPVMDRLVERGRSEWDPDRRRRIYGRVQRRAARELPVLPLWWEDRVVVHRADLRGFEPDPSGDWHGLAAARLAP